MYCNLRERGAPLGITFGRVTLLSNSRSALESSEFARDSGKYDGFHENLFRSYFTEMQDIGQMDVIMQLAGKAGLDSVALQSALQEKRYAARLDNVVQEAHQNRVNSVPTFIIEGKHIIVGAQPIEVFRDTLKKVLSHPQLDDNKLMVHDINN
jgi:predicted DsbA family dithiol-disulfide isomerase